MTFRDAYKEELNLIRADEAVVNNLLLKMREEVGRGVPDAPKPLIKRIPVKQFAATAAGICILLAAAVVIPALLRGAPSFENNDNAGAPPMAALGGETASQRDSAESGTAGNSGIMAEVAESPMFNSNAANNDAGLADSPQGARYVTAEEAEAVVRADDAYDMAAPMEASPPPDAIAEPESEPPTVIDDMAPEISHDEWMLEFKNYYEYYDYQTYKDWDGADTWDNLDGFNLLEIPRIQPQWVRDLPPDTIWDSPFSELIFDTLGEALGHFLSQEHRIVYINYSYTLDEHGDGIGGRLDFYERTLDEAAPIYSMLSKSMNSELASNTEIYLSAIDISILNNGDSVALSIRQGDTLTLSASSTFLSYALEDGTFDKLLSYLLHIE
ncbi:MAG: hypothetical protein FWD48_01960 [Oscillospiraceae bacterium]|nr:hypothetical protein [Oscillospiraceae bacterium]